MVENKMTIGAVAEGSDWLKMKADQSHSSKQTQRYTMLVVHAL